MSTPLNIFIGKQQGRLFDRKNPIYWTSLSAITRPVLRQMKGTTNNSWQKFKQLPDTDQII
jgi:hypothetical protein